MPSQPKSPHSLPMSRIRCLLLTSKSAGHAYLDIAALPALPYEGMKSGALTRGTTLHQDYSVETGAYMTTLSALSKPIIAFHPGEKSGLQATVYSLVKQSPRFLSQTSFLEKPGNGPSKPLQTLQEWLWATWSPSWER